MHRGREDDRAMSGQQHIGEQVIGTAGRGSSEKIGRRGRNENQIDLLADLDVRH